MARWHRDEAQRSRQRHAAEASKSGDKGRWGQPYVLMMLMQLLRDAETKGYIGGWRGDRLDY